MVASSTLVLFSLLAMPISCGMEHAGGEEDSPIGRVELPLVSQANGHTYRLRNPWIYIYGPTFAQLTEDPSSNQVALSTSLGTGAYSALLLDGWSLERDDGSGSFAAVSAQLVSTPWVDFSVYDGATSTISYTFRTDGVIVVVGQGMVRVTATVDEVPPVCAPLGSDCGAGAWCPPSALTGAAVACVAAGTTPLDAPCAAPAECVANSSCFDLGTGPVCAALCTPGQFGGPCDGGGICQQVHETYGICHPVGEAQ